jgi:hypothetical protein
MKSAFGLQMGVPFLTFMLLLGQVTYASVEQVEINVDSIQYMYCKGLVLDETSGKPLSYASILVEGTNMASVTNSDGEFVLKVPEHLKDHYILITYIGFQNARLSISSFSNEIKRVPMKIAEVGLSEVKIVFKDATELMHSVFDLKKENYVTEPTLMTAFYRETIKLKKNYVSLLEAVVDVYKYPISSDKDDLASLYKVRKQTDFTKVDTLVLKLSGGPYNTLYLDVMKNLEYTFTRQIFSNFDFKTLPTTMVDNRPVYVVEFKQKPYVTEPMFYGKLYVDAANLAMFSATFDMNLDDVEKATSLFVLSKPDAANVAVTKAHYKVNYLLRDGKWYMSYGRAEMNFRVNWKHKFFNSTYETIFEMAVTDWKPDTGGKWARSHDKLRPDVVVADETSGFSDTDFWGVENIIEPDKSIETAIGKIQKSLKERVK